MAKELAKLTPFQQVKEMLENQKEAIASVSAKHLDPNRMVSVALRAMATNPKLLDCVPVTVAGALAQAGSLGLDPDPNLRQCALVPRFSKHFTFNGKKGNQVCYLWVQSGGWIQLAYRSNKIKSFEAHVVKEHDEFSYQLGTNPRIDHRITKPDSKRGQVTHAYASAETVMGGTIFRVLDRDEIDKLRAMSDGKDGVFWTDWLDEMAEAKVSKQLAKYLPVSTDDALARAVGIDDTMDGAGTPASPLNITPADDDGLVKELLEKKTQQVTGASNGEAIDKTLISEEQVTKIKDAAHKAGIPLETVSNALLDIVTEAKDRERDGADREEIYEFAQAAAKTLYDAYRAKGKQNASKKAEAKAAPKEPPKDPRKAAPAPAAKPNAADLAENPWMAELNEDDIPGAIAAAHEGDEPPPSDDDAPAGRHPDDDDYDELQNLQNLFG